MIFLVLFYMVIRLSQAIQLALRDGNLLFLYGYPSY